MTQHWWQLTITPQMGLDADWVGDLLTLSGACAVTLTDAEDNPIFEPDIGTTPLWQRTAITGLFLTEADRDAGLRLLLSQCPPGSFHHSLTDLADQDWVRAWMAEFQPMQMGERLWICPSWETPPQADAVNIILDPGLAFGTGTHPTTALCLRWLDQQEITNKTVVDYGCGSGILAVAAKKLGAAHVFASDIDVQALQATRANADANQVEVDLFEPMQALAPVDIVIANILAHPLQQLAPYLCSLLKDDGYLVLSGILQSQADDVKTAYAPWINVHDLECQDEWVRICGKKQADRG